MSRTTQFHSRLHQDGCAYEIEVLGRCKVPYRGYLTRDEAFEEVRKALQAKRTDIIIALQREFEHNGLLVPFYTAVGSALDIHHGIDGWFEFRGEVVTIDVTMNPEKMVAKADLVIHPDDLKRLSELAARIGRVFITKMQRR